jgi:hypothetical protein
VVVHAQTVRVDTIREAQPWGQHEVYSFPRVSTPEDPGIAARINKDICTEFLEVDPDTAHRGIFTKVWGEPGGSGMPSVNALTWSWTRPVPDVISVELTGEFCGAYCEDFIIHYNYDLRNGERLRYDRLFTESGLREVTDSLSRRWRVSVHQEVDKLKAQRAVVDTSLSEAEMLRRAITLYTDCMEERSIPYVDDLIPRSGVMIFRMSRCSNHADRAIDELAAVELELSYAWLAPYFRRAVASLFVR